MYIWLVALATKPFIISNKPLGPHLMLMHI